MKLEMTGRGVMDYEDFEPPKHIGNIALALTLLVLGIIGVSFLNSFRGLDGGMALAFVIVQFAVIAFFGFFIFLAAAIARQIYTFRNSPKSHDSEQSK